MYEQVDKRKSGGLPMPRIASARLKRLTLGWKVVVGWTRPEESMRADGVATSLQGKNHGTKWCYCPLAWWCCGVASSLR
jgi:hypothetical protein